MPLFTNHLKGMANRIMLNRSSSSIWVMEITAAKTAAENREVIGMVEVISVAVQEDSLVVMVEQAAVEVTAAVVLDQDRPLSAQQMLQ